PSHNGPPVKRVVVKEGGEESHVTTTSAACSIGLEQVSRRYRNCIRNLMKFVHTSVKLLGWGSVAIGAWGLVHPKSLTALMGDDPALGRPLGLRDAVVGVALLKYAGPV